MARVKNGGITTLVESDTEGYDSGRYVRSGTGDNATYYRATVNAHHDTDSRSNEVTVNVGSELYRPVESVGGVSVEDAEVTFTDAGGKPMDDARLVATGSQYFIAQGSGDSARYSEASVSSNAEDNTISVRARSKESLGPPSFSEVEQMNGSSTVTLDPKTCAWRIPTPRARAC